MLEGYKDEIVHGTNDLGPYKLFNGVMVVLRMLLCHNADMIEEV